MTEKRRPPAWRRYVRFWGSNVAADVDDELRFHVEMRTREYVARGMSDAEARQAALARLGSVDAAREDCLAIGQERNRQARQADVLESVIGDVRYALRSLARSPAWSAVAMLTIALGIGASTAVFSVVDRLIVRPIAYPGASRIVVVRREISVGSSSHMWMYPSAEALKAWRRSARSIEAVEGYGRRELTLRMDGEAQTVHAISIDTSFLNFAGARAVFGRAFSAAELTVNGPGVVMLAEPFWRRQFGSARDVVGKTLQSDDQSFTIVGVLPATLRLPDLLRDPPDLWLPLVNGGRSQQLAGAMARLRPGTTAAAAAAELDSIARRAGIDLPPEGLGSKVQLIRPGETLSFRRTLVMLAGAVALLLLVACANVAHLLLARGAARERELAVRYALGAGRPRLIRQLITESLVLAALGGVAALCVGVAGLRAVGISHPPKLVALSQVPANRGVALVAALLTLTTGLAIGCLVGVRTARAGIGETLRGGSGARGTGARGGRRLRSSLVVTEIALSATLLVGALLLVRGMINLQNAPLGFDARNLYGLTVPIRGPQFASAAQRAAFARQLLARARQMIDSRAVTLAATVPPTGGFFIGAFETEGTAGAIKEAATVSANYVAADYFAVLGIPLVAGHPFDETSDARGEVIVNQTLARQLWSTANPVGKRFSSYGISYVVAGVARDAVTHGLLSDAIEPALYWPLATGLAQGKVTLIVRGPDGVNPMPALRRLATELRAAASTPAITNVEQTLSESLAEPRFSMVVLATFAALAVVLAAVGLYGVISYTVAQRTREIGIRMTLGATRASIARLVVGDGLRLSLVGVTFGLLGAIVATRVLESAVYGVRRGDPWSFAIGAAALVGISGLACFVPTMRATSVDPVIAVRAE